MGCGALPERNADTEQTGAMKSSHMYESKLPERFCEALRALYDQRKNETFVFSVDGYGPLGAEILRRNFQNLVTLQRRVFGPYLKHGVCIKARQLMRI